MTTVGGDDRAPGAVLRSYLLLAAFLCGACVMVLEMAAVRAVAPFFGSSAYTWTNVIGVMMAALAGGYYLGGRLADRVPRPVVLFLVVLGGGVLAALVPLAVRPLARFLLPVGLGVEDAMGHLNRASLLATLLLFAPPTLLLGGVSPITIRLLARPDQVGGAAGRVFASSTVGSIAGTFLTTHVLVPGLGTRLTFSLAGLVLCAVGLAGLLLAAVSMRLRAAGGAAAAAAALLAALSAGAGPVKAGEGQIVEAETAYQYVRVCERGDPAVRLLQINEAEEAYQSVKLADSVLTEGRYYDYYSLLPLLLGAPERGHLDSLVIGLAGGTIPAQLRRFYPAGLRVTGVEIDPGILAIARQHFDLPAESDWFRSVVADGRAYLNGLPRTEAFDLVIIDAFANERYVPFHLATREAFAEVRDRLRPGGILAMNVAGYRPDEALVNAITSTVADVFGRAFRTWVQSYPNFVVFAVKGGEPSFGRLLRPPSLPGMDGTALRDLARYAATSTAPIDPVPGAFILTDDHAPVERLTEESMAREWRAAMGE